MVQFAHQAALGDAKTANFKAFERFFKQYHTLELSRMRENAGYTNFEIAHLREKFNSYDMDGNGELQEAELRSLLAVVFPEATKSVVHQRELNNLLNRVDRNK